MLYGNGVTDDTAALQELLDKRGIVTVDRPGTYLVSKTLIIRSNTRFVLSPGVHILAAPMSRCALIENEHFRGGIDENIEIIGGIWDGNCDNMGLDGTYEAIHREDLPYSPDLFRGKLMRFAHVRGILLERLTVRDPVSYGIQIADAVGFVTRDIRFDYNCNFGTTDGVHINGPAYNGVIENLYGTTNDDMVSLTTTDESHAEVTVGEIVNVDIRNISAENGYSGVRLLSVGGFDIRCVRISGVWGEYRHNAVLLSHHNMRRGSKIRFDDITIEHVHASKYPYPLSEDHFTYWEHGTIEKNPVIWLEGGIDAGSIVIRDVIRRERAETGAALIRIDKGASIERLVIDNVYQTVTAGQAMPPMIVNNGNIGTLIVRDAEQAD